MKACKMAVDNGKQDLMTMLILSRRQETIQTPKQKQAKTNGLHKYLEQNHANIPGLVAAACCLANV